MLAPEEELLSIAGVTNSAAFDYLFKVALGRFGFPEFVVGVLQKLPFPELTREDSAELSRLAKRAWSLRRSIQAIDETSHAFTLPALLLERIVELNESERDNELAALQRAIDSLAARLYGLNALDYEKTSASLIGEPEGADDTEDNEDPEDTSVVAGFPSLYSWTIGVAFGHFDDRLATGDRTPPPEPEPFDPLPARSPGMIPEADEAQFPARPLLVDDPGHALDLTARAGDVLERVGFPPESPETLRRWLARDFFPLHIKMYSKSRRKAPIYWQLATPSASYSVWLYIHAFTRDTLFKVQNDYASPKLAHEERQLESFRTEVGDSPTAAERRELAARQSFVEELRAFLDEVKRVAPLWNPDLDDGVIINFAPLWRLVPQHKPWQKELKATWDALCAGEYDWAHLAMHLWPERVVPKCAIDRSLAIAHGLEEVFWFEGEDGKWKPRPIPARSVEQLVSERTSPAVKAALHSLLEAPAVTGGAGRGRPRRGRGDSGATT